MMPYSKDESSAGRSVFGKHYKRGFRAGAQWRINSVWHDKDEKPKKNQLVLFECEKVYTKGYTVSFGENHPLLEKIMFRWAYIADLLPQEKEEK